MFHHPAIRGSRRSSRRVETQRTSVENPSVTCVSSMSMFYCAADRSKALQYQGTTTTPGRSLYQHGKESNLRCPYQYDRIRLPIGHGVHGPLQYHESLFNGTYVLDHRRRQKARPANDQITDHTHQPARSTTAVLVFS